MVTELSPRGLWTCQYSLAREHFSTRVGYVDIRIVDYYLRAF